MAQRVDSLSRASDRPSSSASRRVTALAVLSAKAVGATDLDALLRDAAARAGEGLGTGRAHLLEYRAATRDFLLRAGLGRAEALVGRAAFAADAASPAGHVLRTGAPLAIANLADQRWFMLPTPLREEGLVAFLGVPIPAADGAFGVLEVAADRPRRFAPDEVEFLLTVANLVGAAIRREEIGQALRASEDRFRVTFGQAAVGLAHVGLDGRWLRVNRRLCEITGYAEDELLGRTFQEITHPEDIEADLANVGRLLAGERATYAMEKRYIRRNGRPVWIRLTVSLLRDAESGAPRYFISAIEDIDQQKAAETAIREREERLRAALHASGTGTYRRDLRSNLIDRDDNLRQLYGMPPGETVGDAEDLYERVHPEDRAALVAAVERSVREGDDFDIDYRVVLPDGGVRWVSDKGKTFLDADGRPLYVTGACVDATERKQAEEHRKLLLAELNHRVKNTLAVVQSIAAQTLRRAASLEGFAESFTGRLQALAAAHGLLTQGNWRTARLDKVVRQALKAHGSGRRAVEIAGPDLALTPKQTLALSLVLHELATNAAKYGALSRPAGRVEVRWALEGGEDGEAAGRALRFDWAERDGPPVTAPARPGFGTSLIERTIAYDLDGRSDLAYLPEGLRCRIVIPWEE